MNKIDLKDSSKAQMEVLFPPVDDQSWVVIGSARRDYSASVIARAVEDCDATVLSINVTGEVAESADLVVLVRFNRRNPYPIARSLERFGYTVLRVCDTSGGDAPESDVTDGATESMRLRANNLIRILEI